MKVAVTIWEGRISPVFDACREVRLLEIEGGSIAADAVVALETDGPDAKVERLVELGVKVLVCGAISEPLQSALLDRGMDVIGFVAGKADEVVNAYLSGVLPNHGMAMPGCCARRRRHRRRRRGRGAPNAPNVN